MQGWNLLNPIITRVAAGVDKKDFEASDGKVGGDRASTSAGTDDYIIIFNGGIAFADKRIMLLGRRTPWYRTANVSEMQCQQDGGPTRQRLNQPEQKCK
jgi:hypothetical protein